MIFQRDYYPIKVLKYTKKLYQFDLNNLNYYMAENGLTLYGKKGFV